MEQVFRSEPQSSSVTARLVTLEDLLTENTETLRVRIVPGEGQVVNPALSEVTVFITDDDSKMYWPLWLLVCVQLGRILDKSKYSVAL